MSASGNPLRSLGQSPILDGRTPVFLEIGANPTLAPGLQLPPGSVAVAGSTYYFKQGPLATDWILVSAIGGSGSLTVDAPLTGAGTPASHLAIPAATTASAGHMTAAQATTLSTALQSVTADSPLTGAGTAASHLGLSTAISNNRSLLTVIVAEALSVMGLTGNPEKLAYWFQPFFAIGEQGLSADVTGTTSGSAAGNQAWLLQANASGIRNVIAAAGPGSAAARLFLAGSAKRFFMKACMQLFDTPSTNGETFGIGLKTSAAAAGSIPSAFLGYSRTASTTKWIYTANSTLTSTVSVNAGGAFSTATVYRDGTTTTFYVDAETPITSATARHTIESFIVPGFVAASASAQFRGQIKWSFFATELE